VAVVLPFESPGAPSIDPLVDLVAADMERVNGAIISRTGSEVTMIPEVANHLINSGGNGIHWLLVSTRGFRSNRDGIVATLKLTTASGRTLYNHVTTSVGFMSSSDKRVHFGLGAEKVIASLEIRWPGGIVQTLKKVQADRILTVTEPAR